MFSPSVLGRIQPRRCFLSSFTERDINLRYKTKQNWLKKLKAICRQEPKVPLTSTEELLQWNSPPSEEGKKGRKGKRRKVWLAWMRQEKDKAIKKHPNKKTSIGTAGTRKDWSRIKHLYFKHYVTWLEMNSFAEDIEWVPLLSNLHLSEQPPEDSAQTSKTKIV